MGILFLYPRSKISIEIIIPCQYEIINNREHSKIANLIEKEKTNFTRTGIKEKPKITREIIND